MPCSCEKKRKKRKKRRERENVQGLVEDTRHPLPELVFDSLYISPGYDYITIMQSTGYWTTLYFNRSAGWEVVDTVPVKPDSLIAAEEVQQDCLITAEEVQQDFRGRQDLATAMARIREAEQTT